MEEAIRGFFNFKYFNNQQIEIKRFKHRLKNEKE